MSAHDGHSVHDQRTDERLAVEARCGRRRYGDGGASDRASRMMTVMPPKGAPTCDNGLQWAGIRLGLDSKGGHGHVPTVHGRRGGRVTGRRRQCDVKRREKERDKERDGKRRDKEV